MLWANLVHVYHPRCTDKEILLRWAGQSLRPLITLLRRQRHARMTVALNARVSEQLDVHHLDDILSAFRDLAAEGRIEFAGSAKFHPILPLIPKDEMRRQIRLNDETNRSILGPVYAPIGFVPPELAISPEVFRTVEEMGYRWIAADEIAFAGKLGRVRRDAIFEAEGTEGLVVHFIDRRSESRAATWTPCRPGLDQGLEKILEDPQSPEPVTLTQLAGAIPRRDRTVPFPSCRTVQETDMRERVPFPQWNYPGHELHRRLWELTHGIIESVATATVDISSARSVLDEALTSTAFGAASCRPWWNPQKVLEGTRRFRSALESVGPEARPSAAARLEQMIAGVEQEVSRLESSGEARRLQDSFRKTHPEIFDGDTDEG
jgi:hypothetical protein